MPAKTITKSSPPGVVGRAAPGSGSLPLAASTAEPAVGCGGRRRAWLAISTARRSCGRPPPENSGSFWPRTRLFIRSSVVMPVSMKSRGRARATGFIGNPSIGMRRCVATGGPPSMTWPTPLKTRPRMPGPRPKVSGSPRKRTTALSSESPLVDSSTSMVMNCSSIAAMRPSRGRPSAPRTSTASCRPTSSVRRRNSSGPSSLVAAPSTVSRIAALRGGSELRELALDACLELGQAWQLVVADLLAHALQRAQAGEAADSLGLDAVAQRCFGEIDEAPEQPHHGALARRAADPVDLGKRRLAQERFVDELGREQRELLARRQRVLADDARHAFELGLLVEQREEAPAQREPLAVALRRPPRRELARVLRVRLQRVDGGIEAGLRALDVEGPEGLHVAFGVARHRLGEVARRRADRTHHGHRSAAAAECLDQRCALVEVGETARQVGRVAAFARQLAEAARDLAQRFGPATGGVVHQRDVQALVAEILGHR